MQRTSLLLTLATAVLLIGCVNSNMSLPAALTDSANIKSKASDSPKEESSFKDEPIEFNGVTKMKSELSEETLKWLDWYSTLPEENRNALSFIPSEFINSRGVLTIETDCENQPSYTQALTLDELSETEKLARVYFSEGFDGIEEILLAKDDFFLYQNTGIEAEYTPGNIIIYMVLTGKDKAAGNPMRSVSIARKSKSDSWKVINSGF